VSALGFTVVLAGTERTEVTVSHRETEQRSNGATETNNNVYTLILRFSASLCDPVYSAISVAVISVVSIRLSLSGGDP
jgi:hypothetical protein